MDWKIIIIVAVVLVGFFVLKRASFVSLESALQHLAAGALVIDVRSPGEFHADHVTGAINIPLNELGERLPREVKDKHQVILLHCLSGGRSAMAKQQALRLGYTNAFNLGSLGRARSAVQSARQGDK